MPKPEAQFTTRFKHWITSLRKYQPAAYEIKVTKKTSIPFSAVKAHQIEALQAVKHSRFFYKIPDDAYAQKPFDCITLTGGAYIVLAFLTERKPASVYIIDVDDFLRIKQIVLPKRRSLNEKTLLEHASAQHHII